MRRNKFSKVGYPAWTLETRIHALLFWMQMRCSSRLHTIVRGRCISQSLEMWWTCLWKPHWIGFRRQLITSSPKTLPWPMCKLLNCISFAFKTKVHEFWFKALMQDIVLWKIYFSSSLSRSKAKIISVVLWNSEFIVSKIKTAACIEFCFRIGA